MDTKIDYQERINTLLSKTQADVIALVPGSNMVYFTGLHFHLMERPIIALLSNAGVAFIIPELEIPMVEHTLEMPATFFAWNDATGYTNAFRDAAINLNLIDRVLAVDGLTMRVFEWLTFKKVGVSADDALDVRRVLLGVRAIKSTDEIERQRRAMQLSEVALQETLRKIQLGMTERTILSILKDELVKAGSQGLGFDPIVLTGEKTGQPHGNPADRPLGEDELLLFDFGGIVDGYSADITRTFCFGTPSDEIQRMHQAVLQANEAAMLLARPGVTAGEVDQAARDVIENAGFGEYFIHRTGHGLGLEMHEYPNIAPHNDTVLEPGMVFTIEPGVYIPDVGGIRIEDVVAITDDGVDCLTSFPRTLTFG